MSPGDAVALYPGHGAGQWSVDRTLLRLIVTLRCPRCGEPHRLPNHSIASDGAMTPVVECRRCFWSAAVRLLEWG